jgi:hypothetical protein
MVDADRTDRSACCPRLAMKEQNPAPVAQTIAAVPAPTPVAEPVASPKEKQPAAPPTDKSVGNAFLANLSAYQPIYAVYGPGTNTDARIQISFKYKLFGSSSADMAPPTGIRACILPIRKGCSGIWAPPPRPSATSITSPN